MAQMAQPVRAIRMADREQPDRAIVRSCTQECHEDRRRGGSTTGRWGARCQPRLGDDGSLTRCSARARPRARGVEETAPMKPRSNKPSSTRLRRYAGIGAAVALALAGALVPTGPASAASGPFAINGLVVPDAGVTQLNDAFGSVKELGPKNASTTKIGVIHNAASPMLDATNPNGQVDLRRAWLGSGQ